MAKLTLHVPEELVVAAKSEAAARNVSVSKLVTDFFRNLPNTQDPSAPSAEPFASRTQRLAGCIPEAKFEDYLDHLEKKHS